MEYADCREIRKSIQWPSFMGILLTRSKSELHTYLHISTERLRKKNYLYFGNMQKQIVQVQNIYFALKNQFRHSKHYLIKEWKIVWDLVFCYENCSYLL